MTSVVGYVRVSTDEQGRSGLGLDAQREAIQSEASRRGWSVIWIADEGCSAKDMNRPGIQQALCLLEGTTPLNSANSTERDEQANSTDHSPEASVLVVAKLDRLSRSVLDFLTLAERAKERGWSIVVLDMGMGESLDMASPTGKFTAAILAAVAELERELISSRTKAALARAKARGTQLGRRPAPTSTAQRIQREREAGRSLRAIAEGLNTDRVPTSQGGQRWYASTVRSVLLTREAAT